MLLLQDAVNPKDIDNLSLGNVPDSIGSESDIGSVAGTSTNQNTPPDLSLLKNIDSDDELDILNDMIQTSQFHHPHHRAFQVSFFFSCIYFNNEITIRLSKLIN